MIESFNSGGFLTISQAFSNPAHLTGLLLKLCSTKVSRCVSNCNYVLKKVKRHTAVTSASLALASLAASSASLACSFASSSNALTCLLASITAVSAFLSATLAAICKCR